MPYSDIGNNPEVELMFTTGRSMNKASVAEAVDGSPPF